MLNLRERHRVLEIFSYCCTMNPFQVQVDLQSWQISLENDTNWKRWASKVSYVLFIAHTIYKTFTLIYATLLLQDTPLHQTVIHGASAGIFLIYMLWWYVLYYKHSDVNAELWNLTFSRRRAAGI